MDLYEGILLFAEQQVPADEGKMLEWEKEFESSSERFVLSFNNPKTHPDEGFDGMLNTVVMKKLETVEQLIARIAEKCGLSVNEIIVHRTQLKRSIELRSSNRLIGKSGLRKDSNLFVEIGDPSTIG